MQIHLDLLGGLAGDMFIAALLDAFPEHAPAVVDRIATLSTVDDVRPGQAVGAARLLTFHDGVLQGRRFDVGARAPDPHGSPSAHRHARAQTAAGDRSTPHSHPHGDARPEPPTNARAAAGFSPSIDGVPPDAASHIRWSTIRRRLEEALPPPIRVHALGIFGLLAEAEAEVHGIDADDVEFHEVGAWDSIADIVGAACLIDLVGANRWTVGPIPLGRGRVTTAHGPMPVPAPATALLLRGFATLDDGIGGERVTPTGAAIIRYLVARDRPDEPRTRPLQRILRRSGVGFGTRLLPGISNCVRVLVFEEIDSDTSALTRHPQLAVIEFEVDDQSAEDLAIGLDRLRRRHAIFDVVQAPVFGKKGRMMTAVRVLAHPVDIDDAIAACFRETTTIGLRHRVVDRVALTRRADEVTVRGRKVRVKTVERPGGRTAKAESDDAVAEETQRERSALRAEAERMALDASVGDVANDDEHA